MENKVVNENELTDRKLASLQRVSKLESIPGCTMIELATVMGWKCIVKKGEFRVGDLGVYFEIDSKLPNESWCSFMEKHSWRVKTMKMRGVVSQGLMLPLSLIPHDVSQFNEDDDLTRIFGVTKWAPEAELSFCSNSSGMFPRWLQKTDEMRIQSNKYLLEETRQRHIYITEKVDGTSYTAFYVRDEKYGGPRFGLCSRNFELQRGEDARWHTADKLDLERKMRELDRNIAIQCELIGPKIQKNKYGVKEHELFMYSVYDIDEQKYLGYNDLVTIAVQLGIKTVPIVDSFVVTDELFDFCWSVDDLVNMSKGKSALADVCREGIVVRTMDDPRVSFKVINPDFLLKFDE